MTGHPDAASTGQHLPVEHGTPEARRAAPTREERYAGALLGVHAGDALGATCEFQSWAAIRRTYPDGLRDIPTALAVSDDIVRVGNDTDTNAAIAGGLLGARDGLPAIPAGWVEVLQFREEFLTAAHRIRGQA